ncbi:MAG: 1,4-alpha-glucan (glycogen) branching enzyme GH3-type [Ferruginibacter sp.]|nr:1,4-alpha-glucan (glycogen) branching enzyme GH3-type [Ferruginibacter sp.]
MAYEDDHFIDSSKLVWNYSFFTADDCQAFKEGTLVTAHEKFGSHFLHLLDTPGFYFAVWAPNATAVSVIGDFNGWKKQLHPLFVRLDHSGIWEGFIPRLPAGALYKYQITGFEGKETFKADPYAVHAELRPGTASITWHLEKFWHDEQWMKDRKQANALNAPWSVYEVHLGSWMRPDPENENLYNSYDDLSERLVPYVKAMGFTHVEFMPVMEHPYDGSWGYQGTGYFAATSRYGTPEALMHLIDRFHQENIGVILDWVPSHFPADAHGLYEFDGTHTYEYEDMRKGFHPDWNSYIFNYARGEVRSFLLSSAHFWLDKYHIDGLRVDAVNSIIRLDFSRKEGEWEPNIYGGNENLEAISFLKDLNRTVYKSFPHVQTIAEEASDWPGITTALNKDGFGFGMKWMMGWMHDNFRYFKKTGAHRMEAQDDFTFSIMYFYDEKFMLPLSHDEVVHGKSPLLYKMPGNEWEQFANLRLLYSWMFLHPGAKLLFMGNEFGQTHEWNYNRELDWPLLQFPAHNNLQECVRELNHLYTNEPALHELQFDKKGFEWINIENAGKGILVFKRNGKNKEQAVICVLNMSTIPQTNWKISLKGKTQWKEIFNSNAGKFWGSNDYLNPDIISSPVDKKKKVFEISLHIPPLGAILLK